MKLGSDNVGTSHSILNHPNYNLFHGLPRNTRGYFALCKVSTNNELTIRPYYIKTIEWGAH